MSASSEDTVDNNKIQDNMATKLHGLLNVTKLGELIRQNPARVYTNSKGEKCIWIDVLEKRTPDMYGSTHTVTFYDKDAGTTYLADLKPQEFGNAAASAPQSAAPAPTPAAAPTTPRKPLYEVAQEMQSTSSATTADDFPF